MTRYYRYRNAGLMLAAIKKITSSSQFLSGKMQIIIGVNELRSAPFYFYIESRSLSGFKFKRR